MNTHAFKSFFSRRRPQQNNVNGFLLLALSATNMAGMATHAHTPVDYAFYGATITVTLLLSLAHFFGRKQSI